VPHVGLALLPSSSGPSCTWRGGKTYGALASIVVVLLWLWPSSLVILIGAEVDGADGG
jgi:hypothetical protein